MASGTINGRQRALLVVGIGLLGAGQAHPAWADTVWMNNGDRLSGQIAQLDAGKLRLISSYGGTIDLDWDQVKAVETASDVSISDARLRTEYQARTRNADHAAPAGTDATATPTPAATPAAGTQSTSFWKRLGWKGNLDLGLNYETASTRTEDYSAKLDTRWRQGRWRHNLKAHYARETDDSVTTAHNYGANLASNRFVSERFFWQGRALYKWDQLEDVSRQAALGIGPGVQLWENDQGAFSLAGLIGRTRYEYNDGASENFYATSLRWDYSRYLGGPRFELYTNGELMRPLNSATNLSIDAVVGMRYRMTDWLSWFLNYSRNQISGGRRSLNEKRVSTGLGLTW